MTRVAHTVFMSYPKRRLAAACARANVWDERAVAWARRLWHRWPTFDAASVVLGRWAPLAMVFTMGWAAATGVPRALGCGLCAVAAAVAVRVANEIAARLVHRPRPFEQMAFVPLLAHGRGDSFPSNHAAGAFALAVAFWPVPGYRVLLVCLAILLCVSRVYHGLHYPSDVIAGAWHGAVMGLAALWLIPPLA